MDSVNELIARLREIEEQPQNCPLTFADYEAIADLLLSQAQEIERIRRDAGRALGNMIMLVPEDKATEAHLWMDDAIAVLHSLDKPAEGSDT